MDPIKPETRFIEDLKADSMDQFFLIDGLSEKFDVTISDEDAARLKAFRMQLVLSRLTSNN
jgi:acyl carrier protein